MAQYLITTPEQVQFRYQIAGLTTRAMAWLLDQVILMALRVVVVFALSKAGAFGNALIICLFFLLEFGYYVVCELYMAGQSPGKRKFGLRVISSTGARLRFADVMIRNLLRPLDYLPFAMFVGGVTAWIDPHRRRLGDMAADTLVVRDVRNELPQLALKHQSRDNSYAADAAVRSRILARVGRDERDLIFDLMLRRDELEPKVREDLFARTASLLRDRCQLPEMDLHLTDEQAVLNVALVLETERKSSSARPGRR